MRGRQYFCSLRRYLESTRALADDEWNAKVQGFSEEVYALSLKLGGNISGEHGIGLIRKQFLVQALGETEEDGAIQLQLMKQIKKAFDPNNILNPQKIFDL